jgi:hypothetical protein
MPLDALKTKIEFLPQTYDLRGKIKLKGRAYPKFLEPLNWDITCKIICNTRLGILN